MLNWKEDRVVKRLKSASGAMTIRELARACFPGVRPVAKADSQVRNSIRKPFKLGLIRKVGEGSYSVAAG